MKLKQYSPNFRILFFIILSLMLSSVQIACAATNSLDEPFGDTTKLNISSMTQAIFEFGIALCVLAAAIYIAWGSLQYFLAAGDAKKAGDGKEIIGRAITGLVLALVSWIILNTISTQFTQLKKPDGSGLQVKSAPNT